MLMVSYKYIRRTYYDVIPGSISGIKIHGERDFSKGPASKIYTME
jgi:hypothetical protein